MRRTRRQRCRATRAGRRPSRRRSAGTGPRSAGSAARARTRAAARHLSWSSHRGALPGTEATAPGSAAGPGQDLMSAADHGLVVGQADGDVRAGHVPGHGRSVPLSCCASRAPAKSTGMSSPLNMHQRAPGRRLRRRWREGMTCLSGPVSRLTASSLGHRRRSGPATSGVCARGAARPAAVLAAHRAGARRGPRAQWPGCLALAVARRAARAICGRPGPGARRPYQGHRRLAACPQTWPAVPPASAAARGRRPDASCPGLAPSRIRRWCAHRVPVDARNRVRAGCDTRPGT